MRKEKLKIIEFVPIKKFTHKIKLTKENKESKMQIIDKHLYIERCRYE